MAYTVKKLSELSGVTVRALHYYEEEGLIAPAYYGSNGYRYYGEKELLRLQQILFFKELGLTIKQIKKVLGKSDFDQLAALHSHKRQLQQEWNKIGKLIQTIENTIEHLKGAKKMKDNEFFDGFTLITKAEKNETYSKAEELVLNSVRKPTKQRREPSFYAEIHRKANEIFTEVSKCIDKDLELNAKQTQACVRKHFDFVNEIHDANREVYEALASLYREHPEFKKQLVVFHPNLPEFLAGAMGFFAKNELS